ncbi:MAG: UDP-glucose dehydrogenase family protein [Candidatus Rariloculaceae bacterium]
MRVTIFGSGYVGLVTGACLADAGNDVLCVDADPERIECLQSGQVSFYEPGLEALVKRGCDIGRLKFTSDVAAAIEHGLLQFIAVGTPSNEDGSADLRHVLAVAGSIGEHMNDYRIVIDKSTVPVGTADRVKAEIQSALDRRRLKTKFDIMSNPEFLREGSAIADFTKPDRIVIGTDNPRAAELICTLYEPFNRSGDRVIIMDIRSAELTKYAANAMLATRISFINEIANLAERVGADIENVRIGIGSDPRIGDKFLYPGCGYGGSCLPKDVEALGVTADQVAYDAPLLDAVELVNQRQKKVLFAKINDYFESQLQDKTVALWGLSFKPGTDDIRESSSRYLMEALWDAGCNVRAYDPVAIKKARYLYGDRSDLTLCELAEDALEGADALVIATGWREFLSPDFTMIKNSLKTSVIFDGRNLYDPQKLRGLGIDYFAIGRSNVVERNVELQLIQAKVG